MRAWLLVLASVFLAACSAPLSGGSSDDSAKWQGTWKMVSAIAGGEQQQGDMSWVVDGDHYTIILNGQHHMDPYYIKLDHGRVDVFHHDTPAGTYGGSLKGIYKLSGDSLTVCYDLKGARYPRSFDAGVGSGQVLYQFQRTR